MKKEEKRERIQRLRALWSKGRTYVGAIVEFAAVNKGSLYREQLSDLRSFLRKEDEMAQQQTGFTANRASKPSGQLLVLWKKAANMYSSFFTVLIDVKTEINDDWLFVEFCENELNISLARCINCINTANYFLSGEIRLSIKKELETAEAASLEAAKAAKAARAALLESLRAALAAQQEQAAVAKQRTEQARKEAAKTERAQAPHKAEARLTGQAARDARRNARRSAERALARAGRKCAHCGASFTPARSTGRFCCAKCRYTAKVR